MMIDKEQSPEEEQQSVSESPEEQPESKENQASGQETEAKEQEEEKKAEEPTPEEQIIELQGQLLEQKEKYLRLYSEFENYRRRTAKERSALIQTAGEDIMKEILPILDDFTRAKKSFPEAKDGEELEPMVTALRDSVKLIDHKLRRTLEQKGLKPMESSIGKAFDPELHEAITQIPAPSEDMKGKVVDEIEQGYYLGEKILRFAKVVVGA